MPELLVLRTESGCKYPIYEALPSTHTLYSGFTSTKYMPVLDKTYHESSTHLLPSHGGALLGIQAWALNGPAQDPTVPCGVTFCGFFFDRSVTHVLSIYFLWLSHFGMFQILINLRKTFLVRPRYSKPAVCWVRRPAVSALQIGGWLLDYQGLESRTLQRIITRDNMILDARLQYGIVLAGTIVN